MEKRTKKVSSCCSSGGGDKKKCRECNNYKPKTHIQVNNG